MKPLYRQLAQFNENSFEMISLSILYNDKHPQVAIVTLIFAQSIYRITEFWTNFNSCELKPKITFTVVLLIY